MKIIRVHIIRADTCGGLLDGLDLQLRDWRTSPNSFEPLCLIGPNGAGKSQLIQAISEIFQTAFHAVVPNEERRELNPSMEFELEYSISPPGSRKPVLVRIARVTSNRKSPKLTIHRYADSEWRECKLTDSATKKLLPQKVVGYTSGGNETLSLPFLLSRGGYAKDVTIQALHKTNPGKSIADTRLMLVDYSTHLEVLVANILVGTAKLSQALLKHANLRDLNTFRIVIQLAHSAAPKAHNRPNQPTGKQPHVARKGIQLTDELETTISRLRSCATCSDYDESIEKYTFDYYVDSNSKKGFKFFWKQTLHLYSSLRKLSMLNDLAITKRTRDRFERDTKTRRFASRLPEPQDEEKVFRFERVTLDSLVRDTPVDYVSLSDGEHQLSQVLGTFAMISFPGVLFLLDEPESHSNPQWRTEFITKLMSLETPTGDRRSNAKSAHQDCLMTTHAPFIPSDIDRNRVLIFSKDTKSQKIKVARPEIQTFGSSFEAILEECFGVTPPISQEARNEIDRLSRSKSPKNVAKGLEKLGYSLEKAILADHLHELKKTRK